MSLRLITLGSPRVFHDDRELVELPSQRLRFALLVYLAVEGEASREAVLGLFWPDRDAARGRHALRQMLYELRQLLGEDWVEVKRDRIVVRAEVDAASFEQAAAGGTAAAVDLYGGPFLDGFALDNRSFEGWVDRRRAQLGRLHRRLRGERIEALLAAGDAATALRTAQQWVELDPLEDEASHALIRCLALAGQRLEALQYFDSYERQLAAELQVEPLDETRQLVDRIRAGELTEARRPHTGTPSPAADPQHRQAADEDATAAPQPPSPLATPPRLTGRRRAASRGRSWRRGAIAATGLLAVGSAIALGMRSERPRAAHGTPSARVIILPFSDRSDDSSFVSLAGALTEALARDLAQSRPLDIVSPTGIALLRQRGVSDDSVARLLQADYLVSGSISSGSDWVRVGIELLDGRTGSLVRSDVIERDRAESRILLEDVVARTAGILRREVGDQVEVRRVRSSTASEEAWRAVLEARSMQEPLARLVRYGDYAAFERSIARSDSLLARAAELDRRWAEPLVMRGWLMEQRAFVAAFATPADTASRRKLLDAARSLADRATERDPAEPRAYELRGTVLHQLALLPGLSHETVRARLDAAETELRRSTQLDPNSPSGWRRLAELLTVAGRFAAAKSAAERAYRIDRYVKETNSVVNVLFRTSLELGEDADAERWCQEGRRSFPKQLPFVYCLFALHAWAERIPPDLPALRAELQEYRQSQTVLQPQLLARLETLLAITHVRAGQPDSARAILRRTAAAAHDPGLLWLRASAFGALGDDDEALNSLAAYVADGSWESVVVAQSRPFWRFRGRPQYDRLIDS